MNSISTPRRVALMLGIAAIATHGQGQPYGYPQQVPAPQPYSQSAPGYPQYPQGYGQPQGGGYYTMPPQQQSQYVSPLQFLPTFGKKFGEMFRRVFYGDAPAAQPYYPPQGRLDQPPQGYSGQQPYQQTPQYQQAPQYQQMPQYQQAPRYETPPPPRGSQPSTASDSRMNPGTIQPPATQRKSSTSGSSASKTTDARTDKKPAANYKPPTITREPALVDQSPPSQPSADTMVRNPDKLPGSKPQASTSTADSSSSGSKKPADSPAPGSGGFLRGKKTGKEGRVISPYPPYRELDVSGLSSGSLALDPTTQKVFEVP
jgi:hypothetical protein